MPFTATSVGSVPAADGRFWGPEPAGRLVSARSGAPRRSMEPFWGTAVRRRLVRRTSVSVMKELQWME
jgi:hypothetical protein